MNVIILFPLSVMTLALMICSILTIKKNPKASDVYNCLGNLFLIPLNLILYKNVFGIIMSFIFFMLLILEIARITNKENK